MDKPFTMLQDVDDIELGDGFLPRVVRDLIQDVAPGKSLDDESSQRRITITVLRGKGSPQFKTAAKIIKVSAHTKLAERMALVYAMYKLAFCKHVGLENKVLTRRAVLQHYIR